jgi:glycosyltransferase involved in cell wall biosynthesis
MMKLSVVIITLNEEKNLPRCLQAVKNVADEIVVVDSSSKDRTVAIAKEYGARVIDQPFMGYGRQKNFAVEQAGNDWILSLDADEVPTPELEASILKVKEQQACNAYELARLTNYCGKWVRHCGWYPDKKIRLFNRKAGAWQGDMIHERWEPTNKNEPIGELSGDLLHYSYYTIADHIKQIEKFTELSAREAVAKGKDAGLLKILFSPKWKFFTDFIIKLGFLDGYTGFLVCKYSAYANFVKYTKIRQYARQKGY